MSYRTALLATLASALFISCQSPTLRAPRPPEPSGSIFEESQATHFVRAGAAMARRDGPELSEDQRRAIRFDVARAAGLGLRGADWVTRLTLSDDGSFVLHVREAPGAGKALCSGTWVRRGLQIELAAEQLAGTVLAVSSLNGDRLSLPALAVADERYGPRFFVPSVVFHRAGKRTARPDDE